jgi:SAM-dependent methyltransferase
MKEVWEKQYKENSAPWNYDGFDEDFRKFLGSKFYKDFTVIDLGCGNGSQAHHIEKLGFRVTGTDVVNALEYDIKDFVIDDALDSKLDKKYDLILDRGLIHNLFHLKKKRHKYFEMIGNITHDESYILLKVLSPYEARFNPTTHSGPYRFNEKQLTEFFSVFNFKCIKLVDTYFYSNIQPYLRGYFSIYKKET